MNYPLLLTILIPILAVSCAPNTPQTRISKNPALFSQQSKKNQTLIKQGKIAQGMNKDSVFLAWGKPSNERITVENKKQKTRWTYTSSYARPVNNVQIGGIFSFARSGYYKHRWPLDCGRRWGRPYIDVGSSIVYEPYVDSVVFFEKNKVTSWQINRYNNR